MLLCDFQAIRVYDDYMSAPSLRASPNHARTQKITIRNVIVCECYVSWKDNMTFMCKFRGYECNIMCLKG